ncbi:MAG TPA: thioredoxin [Lachnospiraceae bacterium]|nr:thioredoxin [Lachnospiraceae bacterium]
MVVRVENDNMDEALKSKFAVVDFSATWCGPCQMLAPVMEQLSDELDGQADFYNVDADENPELCAKYGVQSIPAIFLLKDGEVVAKTVGAQPKPLMEKFIKSKM